MVGRRQGEHIIYVLEEDFKGVAMVRDTFRDKPYFDEAVECYEGIILEDIVELDASELTMEIKMRTCFDLINNIISLMHVKYSRGDSVIELKPLLKDAITYRRAQKNLPMNYL